MINHFDFVAAVYDRMIGKPDIGRLRKLLGFPVRGLLLDAGGGTGRVSTYFQRLAGGIVISDLSAPMLQEARKKGNMWVVRAHAEVLPFTDEVFDRVLVVDALHHFCDQERAIGDLLRVLRPEGRLVIEEPDIDRSVVKLVALVEKLALMGSRFYSAGEIRNMIARYGCEARVACRDRFRVWLVVDK